MLWFDVGFDSFLRVVLTGSVLCACGGSSTQGLFSGAGASAGAGSRTSSSGSGGLTGGTVGFTAEGGSIAQGGGLAESGGVDGFGGADSTGGVGDGAFDAGSFGNGGVTGGGSPGAGGSAIEPPVQGASVACNGSTCETDQGGDCCVSVSSTSSSGTGTTTEQVTATCLAAGAPCGFPFTAAHCDGPEDCANGDVCCGTAQTLVIVPFYTSFDCVPAAACGSGRAIACHPQANTCPNGGRCLGTPTLSPDYAICQ